MLRSTSLSVAAVAEIDSFVGRQEDLTALADRFHKGNRLVTLVGPAGIGKTRVAARLLEEQRDKQVTGWFCDVREARDVDAFSRCVAHTLGLQSQDDEEDLPAQVEFVLSAYPEAWLVLDNFEQLVDAASVVLSEWVRNASGLRVLVTSRRVLRLKGEQVYELGPLPLPEDSADSESEAMRLFFDRALAVEPGFRKSEARLKAAVELVRRLEGVPLALELAAGQLRRQSVHELLSRLEHSLELTSDCRDADPRHASLRAAIDSSWELLSLHEREAVLQLTVFRGGFTVAAAEAVLEVGESTVRDVVASLRDASIVYVDSSGSLEDAEKPARRFGMYRSLFEYAEERGGDRTSQLRRHADCYLAHGESWTARLVGQEALAARRWLLEERLNLEQAFETLVDYSNDEGRALTKVARMALVLHAAFRDQMPSRSRQRVERALALVDEVRGTGSSFCESLFTELLLARVQTLRLLGQYTLAQEGLDCLELSAQPDRRLQLSVYWERGMVLVKQGMPVAARAAFGDMLALVQPGDGLEQEGRALMGLGYVNSEAFRDPAGIDQLEKAETLLRAAGYGEEANRARALARSNASLFCRPLAVNAVRSAAEEASRVGDRWAEITSWLALVWPYFHTARFAEARDLVDRVHTLAGQSGLRRFLSIADQVVAMIEEAQGNFPAAAAGYENAASGFKVMGDLRSEGICRSFFAGITARRDDMELAEREIEHASTLFEKAGDSVWAMVAELQRGQIDLARCRQALASGSIREAIVCRKSARERVRAVRRPRDGAEDGRVLPPLAECCINTAFALRMLERELETLTLPELRVWRDASAFQVGEGAPIKLPRGQIMRRVLGALAEARGAVQTPIDTPTLFERGWPQQRVRPATVSLRVRVMVSKLRKLGLDGILLTNDEGYFLDPSLPFAVVDGPLSTAMADSGPSSTTAPR